MDFEETYTKNPSLFPDLRRLTSVKNIKKYQTNLLERIKKTQISKKNEKKLVLWKRTYNYLLVKACIYSVKESDLSTTLLKMKCQLLDLSPGERLKDNLNNKKESCKVL